MASDESPLDRLLPRHPLPNALTVRWNTTPRKRRFLGPTNATADGLLRDVSLNGALVEVDASAPELSVGDHVEVALGETTGTVVIRHATPADGIHGARYGVEYTNAAELKSQLEIVIAHLRGDDGTLQRLWQNAT